MGNRQARADALTKTNSIHGKPNTIRVAIKTKERGLLPIDAGGIVRLHEGETYSIVLETNTRDPSDAAIAIDHEDMGVYRLPPNSRFECSRPSIGYGEHSFVFTRDTSAAAHAAGKGPDLTGHGSNGLIAIRHVCGKLAKQPASAKANGVPRPMPPTSQPNGAPLVMEAVEEVVRDQVVYWEPPFIGAEATRAVLRLEQDLEELDSIEELHSVHSIEPAAVPSRRRERINRIIARSSAPSSDEITLPDSGAAVIAGQPGARPPASLTAGVTVPGPRSLQQLDPAPMMQEYIEKTRQTLYLRLVLELTEPIAVAGAGASSSASGSSVRTSRYRDEEHIY